MPAEYDTNRMTPRQRKDLNRSKLLYDLAIPFLIVGMAASLFAAYGCRRHNPNSPVPNAHVTSGKYHQYMDCRVLKAGNGSIELITQDGQHITIQGEAQVYWFPEEPKEPQ